jgi:hypothetical protein
MIDGKVDIEWRWLHDPNGTKYKTTCVVFPWSWSVGKPDDKPDIVFGREYLKEHWLKFAKEMKEMRVISPDTADVRLRERGNVNQDSPLSHPKHIHDSKRKIVEFEFGPPHSTYVDHPSGPIFIKATPNPREAKDVRDIEQDLAAREPRGSNGSPGVNIPCDATDSPLNLIKRKIEQRQREGSKRGPLVSTNEEAAPKSYKLSSSMQQKPGTKGNEDSKYTEDSYSSGRTPTLSSRSLSPPVRRPGRPLNPSERKPSGDRSLSPPVRPSLNPPARRPTIEGERSINRSPQGLQGGSISKTSTSFDHAGSSGPARKVMDFFRLRRRSGTFAGYRGAGRWTA